MRCRRLFRFWRLVASSHTQFAVLIVACFFFLSGGPGCASRTQRATAAVVRMEKILVLPVQIPPGNANKKTCLRCPICGRIFQSGDVASSAGGKLTDYITGWLRSHRVGEVLREQETIETVLPVEFCGLQNDSGIGPLVEIGRMRNVDGILVGYVFRYEDRRGDAYSVKEPASIAFDLHLIDVRKGEMIWQEAYEETQKALSENLFNIDSFINRKGRWVSADEMAVEGLEGILATHMKP